MDGGKRKDGAEMEREKNRDALAEDAVKCGKLILSSEKTVLNVIITFFSWYNH